ncbi:MAG: threonylcarbamoyl-AMP synthase [Lachnospiraceae bacterium]|nr:threonylcarbamoyl-AMP synthase [Lachnospiraceae bacterium]
METIFKTIELDHYTEEDLAEAVQIIREGGLVAFPTETVYGLGADALKEEAAKKIYAAKGRPSDNPLIVHICRWEDVSELAAEIPACAKKLADAFWPGPLTMVFPKKEIVPFGTTGGLDTVAIRMPSHPLARDLIRFSGRYLAAPSANASGRPSPTKAEHVRDDLDGRIDMILDGGEVSIGLESTVVDVTGEYPVILRPGYVTLEMMQDVVGKVGVDPAILEENQDLHFIPKAPGMKYRHYAPKGSLTIVEGEEQDVIRTIRKLVQEGINAGKCVGVIATEETKGAYPEGVVCVIGSRASEESVAHGLFGILREFDDLGAELIYSEGFGEEGLGRAIMNRLLKAAGHQVIFAEREVSHDS